MRRKLRSKRGETLIEVLASVLVASLSIALLFSAVMAAGRINQSARDADEAFYTSLQNAQTYGGTPLPASTSKKVTLKNEAGDKKEIEVTFYGENGDGGYDVLSYRK